MLRRDDGSRRLGVLRASAVDVFSSRQAPVCTEQKHLNLMILRRVLMHSSGDKLTHRCIEQL
jgi:hypothetical protein